MPRYLVECHNKHQFHFSVPRGLLHRLSHERCDRCGSDRLAVVDEQKPVYVGRDCAFEGLGEVQLLIVVRLWVRSGVASVQQLAGDTRQQPSRVNTVLESMPVFVSRAGSVASLTDAGRKVAATVERVITSFSREATCRCTCTGCSMRKAD